MDVKISEISELFSLAEKKIKLIEHLGEGLTFPAVNQLRYVAFHLLRADSATEVDIKKEEYRKAKNHCQRAIYDAVESGLIYYLEEFKIFQNDYKTIIISDVVTDYLEIRIFANEVSDFISVITKESIGDHCNNRGDQYRKSTADFKRLKDYDTLLNNARPELNKKIQKSREKFLMSIAALIIASLGIIIALIAL